MTDWLTNSERIGVERRVKHLGEFAPRAVSVSAVLIKKTAGSGRSSGWWSADVIHPHHNP
jgi:hypothetical protein